MERTNARRAGAILVALLGLLLASGQCGGGPANRPPVADAGPDLDVTAGETVQLDGTASADPDDDPLVYAWTLESAPAGSEAIVADQDTATASFVPDAAGAYLVRLTVSDGVSESSDDASVTTAAPEGGAPVVAPIPDQSTSIGEPLDVAFVIVDDDPATVVVEASSDDQTLVPDSGIEVLGEGAQRTARITPAAFGDGNVQITLAARDAEDLESSQSFSLAIVPPFQANLISLLPSDPSPFDDFGRAVAIDGNRIVVGAPGHDADGTDSGAAYVFERTDGGWAEVALLTPADGAELDQFGRSVGIHGDYAVVGAPLHDEDGLDAGAVYVYRRSDEGWDQVAKLPPDPPVLASQATNLGPGDRFGSSVAIDGAWVLVGAYFDDDGGDDAGAAYLYERCVATVVACAQPWFDRGAITASDAAPSDAFGFAVATDGVAAIIGAIGEDAAGDLSGSAYTYERDGSTWSPSGKLVASDGSDGDRFGYSVAIDGTWALLGAPQKSDGADFAGAAYAFSRDGAGWSQADKLVAGGLTFGASFGRAVAIDGDFAVVGAPFDTTAGVVYAGSARVFKRSGTDWIEVSKLVAAEPGLDDLFGHAVDVDGDRIVVGAFNHDGLAGTNQGAVFVFSR